MPRSRKAGRKRKRRTVIPRPIAKGIRDINKVTSRVARGIDKYPLAALRQVGKVVLKPRKFPGLRGGGTSCCSRLHPKALALSSTRKKGGRRRRSKKRRGGATSKKKKRAWGMSDVILGAVAAPVEGVRLALGKGGWKRRRGGRKTRRGGRKSRR